MSTTILTKINIDMAQPRAVTVHAKQYDSSSRVIRAHLLNSGEPWVVPSGVYPVIRFMKSDRLGGFYDTDENGNYAIAYPIVGDHSYIDLTLALQALVTAGTVFMELNFYNGDGVRLTSFSWKLLVEEAVLPDGQIVSSEYYNALTETISTIIERAEPAALRAEAAAEAAEESAEEAADWSSQMPTLTADWLSSHIIQPTTPVIDDTLSVSGAAADAKAAGDRLSEQSTRIANLEEMAEKLSVTVGLLSSYVGIVPTRINTSKIKLTGTATASRRLLCFNGQNEGATTSHAFARTLPAGKYKFSISTTGHNASGEAANKLDGTHSTFADRFIIHDGDELELAAPVMIGLLIVSGEDYGTDSDPTYVEVQATEVTAVDKTARERISSVTEIIEQARVSDELPLINNGITASKINDNKIKLTGTATANRRLLCINGQHKAVASDHALNVTIPAGKYKFSISTTGHNASGEGSNKLDGTYSTFADRFIIRDGDELELTAPVMIGLLIVSGEDYGTDSDPTYVEVHIVSIPETVTAVDKVARRSRISKKMAFFGDSIMWGRDGNGSGTQQIERTIPEIVSERTGAVCVNFGVGGMGWLRPDDADGMTAYEKIASTDLTGFDVIIINFGANDGSYTIGEWNTTDESTIMGQVNKTINYIASQRPDSVLIFFAPWNGRNIGTFPDYWYGERTESSTRHSRQDLRNAMAKLCQYYWLPFVDIYDCPINAFNIATALPDGTHPSVPYYEKLGDWMAAKIGGIVR